MTQTVSVIKVLGKGLCSVELRRESACGGKCSSCRGCTAADETVVAVAVNSAGASAGDTVAVESRGKDIYGIAALVYLLPVALLLTGYIAADAISDYAYAPGIFSAVGFAAGILIAVLYGKKQKDKVYLAVTQILSENRQNS
jgi:sigma-E factor negative regulatory protein RseC